MPVIVGIPTAGRGGMGSSMDPRFGNAPSFTLVDISGKGPRFVATIPNKAHRRGECMHLIGVLKAAGVTRIIVGNIGRMAFKACRDLGMEIYRDRAGGDVASVVSRLMSGALRLMMAPNPCEADVRDMPVDEGP